jgi:hypothetical protein
MTSDGNAAERKDEPESDHAVLAMSLPFLFWGTLLLLAGKVANLVDPSFRLGEWIWHGSYLLKLGKAILVAFPVGALAFGTANLVLTSRLRRVRGG